MEDGLKYRGLRQWSIHKSMNLKKFYIFYKNMQSSR